MSKVPQIQPLFDIMRRLRTPVTGCPWDLEQNFASIAPYTIEEAYEVADAIERDDLVALQDELGDLLLQVVFHSQMASEQDSFTLQDVIDGICAKMVRRHPHVFADTMVNDADAVTSNWEEIKAAERQGKCKDNSALADIAHALPSLLRAQKLQKRAARTGFDWPEVQGCIDKLYEEIGEIQDANSAAEQFEEVGDMLFAAVNISRHLGIDAEAALKAANAKFEKRFRAMEELANGAFVCLSLDDKEALWKKVKLRD
jgi:nucleoside triphosphate diphosphatase